MSITLYEVKDVNGVEVNDEYYHYKETFGCDEDLSHLGKRVKKLQSDEEEIDSVYSDEVDEDEYEDEDDVMNLSEDE